MTAGRLIFWIRPPPAFICTCAHAHCDTPAPPARSFARLPRRHERTPWPPPSLRPWQAFFAGRNKLSGELPRSIGLLGNLTKLWLHINELSGELPPSIGRCCSLTELKLFRNKLSGPVPQHLGLCSKMQRLWLNNNEFTSFPVALADLGELVEFHGHMCPASGNVPVAMKQALSQLEVFTHYSKEELHKRVNVHSKGWR